MTTAPRYYVFMVYSVDARDYFLAPLKIIIYIDKNTRYLNQFYHNRYLLSIYYVFVINFFHEDIREDRD